ncbi:hypothetical protein CVT25_009652 [Psilocybe cyanescens]|uniref:Uncharacterized protein n=1 Tax=Psilocybe cyanescens TaxID=93625 RepID=A0A409XGY2_PSICY|nr:hypothetical protein CVT25_009652 [Psilocybe cyanescens]
MDSAKNGQGGMLEAEKTSPRPIEGAQKSEPRRDGPDPLKSDIDRLPLEIIAYMFEFYVNETASCLWLPQRGAFLLGAVCQGWRHIAWTTPPLWTTLVFTFEETTTENRIQLAVEWLKRSGGLPLSITLHTYQGPLENESLLVPLIDIINQSLSRCGHLEIYGLTSLTWSRFTHIRGPSFLRSLRLSPAAIVTPFDLGSQAAPTNLSISGIHLDFLIINWSNLTSFSAYGLHLNEIFKALLLSPQMITCDQNRVMNPISTSPNGYRSLIHSQLKDLRFCLENNEPNNEAIATFFQHMTLPNLKKCTVYTQHTFPANAFTSFLARSYCSMTDLSIFQAVITSEELIRIAKTLPSIISLTLNHSIFGAGPHVQPPLNMFFNALCQDSRYTDRTILPSDVILLPSLQYLSISTTHPFPWAWIPGLCHPQSRFDSDGHDHNETCAASPPSGRPQLRLISIFRNIYASDDAVVDDELILCSIGYLPDSLIESWDTFLELIALKETIVLSLKIQNADLEPSDLFELSYRKLEATRGTAPEYIRESDWVKSYIARNLEDVVDD